MKNITGSLQPQNQGVHISITNKEREMINKNGDVIDPVTKQVIKKNKDSVINSRLAAEGFE